MIVDSSALLAILLDEPEAGDCATAITLSTQTRMSAANFLETAIVIDAARDPVASRELDDVLVRTGITLEPVTLDQVAVARQAYRDFGRGSGHSARLNFGDCFAYALAKTTGEPLLFKGRDFAHTDVRSALVTDG